MTLYLPGICFARNMMLYERVVRTRGRTNDMISLSLEVWEFKIETTAALSVKNRILRSRKPSAHSCTAITIGRSSFAAMFMSSQSEGKETWIQDAPRTAAMATFEASEYILIESDVSHASGRHMTRPLNE